MTLRFWRTCGFALLLLFVQQLALTHALEHVAADVLQLEAPGDADCAQCLALGGLHPGGAAAGSPWSMAAPAAEILELAVTAGPARRPSAAHAIRAPPENRD